MILIIDTTSKKCEVGIIDNAKKDIKNWQWQEDTGTETLENIEKILLKNKKTLKDIEGILVNIGPGSFTGVRVGVTVANTLGWSLNVPVLSYKSDQQKIALDKIKKTNSKNFLKITLPYYSKKQL